MFHYDRKYLYQNEDIVLQFLSDYKFLLYESWSFEIEWQLYYLTQMEIDVLEDSM